MILSWRAIVLISLVAFLVVSGCTSKPSRYKLEQDAAPSGDFDFSEVPDAVPKWEPLSAGGNKSPYTVNGKRYTIMDSAKGYQEEGISSWYGIKFHGELTSNGERYNMYEMSAAHKSLPLPSYLKVTNLDNGLSAIVRVNDRGPFHDDRIIDLSFAAANRLGFANKGTARVKLEAITPSYPEPSASVESESVGVPKKPVSESRSEPAKDRLAPFVQIAAFSSSESADALRLEVAAKYGRTDIFIASAKKSGNLIHRIRVGPFDSVKQAKRFRQRLESDQIGSPIVISRSILGKGQ